VPEISWFEGARPTPRTRRTGTHRVADASEIKSLGHPPNFVADGEAVALCCTRSESGLLELLRYLAASCRLSRRDSTGPLAPLLTRAIGPIAANGDRESRYCESRSATIRAPCSLK
jgi:hypothetical protein